MTANGGPVLVTGGSGFLAGWCCVTLLSQGYTVRATIRDRSREAEVTSRLQRLVDTARLTFYEADLRHDYGWDAAVAGCEYVLHVASPLSVCMGKTL